jgi:hypothetical protein
MSNTQTKHPFGLRFMLSPDGRQADWIHPAEVATRCPGWSDCTDMGDAEFEHFLVERRSKYPPVAR